MTTDRITELDELAEDDAHKLGARFASEVVNARGELAYDGPVSIFVERLGTFTLRIEDDPESQLFDGNQGEWGELREAVTHYDRPSRPSGFDGAARKLDTRSGPMWWQPPMGERGNVELAERVRRYLLEDWCFVGIVLTLEVPGHEDQEASLWGIESDPGAEFLAETINDLASDMQPGEVLENVQLATRLRGWVARIDMVGAYGLLPDVTTEMLALADELDPREVQA